MFRGFDPERDRLVAIKLFRLDLPPERVHRLVAALQRLTSGALKHPAIAAPIAAGMQENTAYLVQEYIAAESLDVVLRDQGPAPLADAVRVARQLADAVDAGVAHGAIHPRDVLISSHDVRVTGFGIGPALEQVGVAAPLRRPYTAPERLAGAAWDRRADIFSIAAVVYEVLAGRRITGPGDAGVQGLAEVSGATPALVAAFGRALAENPADRFETGSAFAEELSKSQVTSRKSQVASRKSPIASRSPAPLENVSPSLENPSPSLERPRLPLEEAALPRDAAELPLQTADRSVEVRSEPDIHQLDVTLAALSPGPNAEDPPPVAADLPLPDPPKPSAPVSPPLAVSPTAPVVPSPVAALPAIAKPVLPPAEGPPARPAVRPDLRRIGERPHTPPLPLSALDRSRSAMWPLALAFVVGVGLGIAFGFGLYPVMNLSPGSSAAEADSVPGPAATTAAVSPGPPFAPAAREVREPPLAEPQAATQALEPVARPPEPATVSTPPPEPRPAASGPRPPTARPVPPAVEQPGRLLVRSTPAGARVFVDGRDHGPSPAEVRGLAVGVHTVRIIGNGFVAEERQVGITVDRPAQNLTITLTRQGSSAALPDDPAPVPVPPVAAAAAPQGPTGTLLIESRPPGATVYLDGRLLGVTPMLVSSLRLGAHQVRLELDGYQSWSVSTTVTEDGDNRVTGSLER